MFLLPIWAKSSLLTGVLELNHWTELKEKIKDCIIKEKRLNLFVHSAYKDLFYFYEGIMSSIMTAPTYLNMADF